MSGEREPTREAHHIHVARGCMAREQWVDAVSHYEIAFRDDDIRGNLGAELLLEGAVAALRAAEASSGDEATALRHRALEWVREDVRLWVEKVRDLEGEEDEAAERERAAVREHVKSLLEGDESDRVLLRTMPDLAAVVRGLAGPFAP